MRKSTTAANSALLKSRADNRYSTFGHYSASDSGGRVIFKFNFKLKFHSVSYISNSPTQHQKPWPSAMQFVG